MKVGEIIQRIQSLYSKGVQSDDVRLTNRHIYNKIVSIRAKLISQQVKKKQKISQWNYQLIPYVELKNVRLSPSDNNILRTKYVLPKPITNLNNHMIQSVTSLNGDIIYSEIGWIEKKYKYSNKYTSKQPDFFIRDNYLYTTYTKGQKVISIVGLFEDPLEIENYRNSCESPLDKVFPIDNDMVDTLVELCVNELVILFSKMTEDLTNNSRDNIIQQSK